MGNGFGRPHWYRWLHRSSLAAAASLAGLGVSCSSAGPRLAADARQPADARVAPSQSAARVRPTGPTPATDADGAPAPAQDASASPQTPAFAAVRIDEDFDAPKLERQFEAVARRVVGSVVAISAVDSPVASDEVQHAGRTNPDKLNAALESQDRTVGTGLVVAAEGYILTNEHVVGRAAQIWVTTDDRKVYPAVVVGSDPRADLAVLKVPAAGLRPVAFAAAPARRGQWAIAIGNPYGLAGDGELAVSVGVVSAVGRSLPKLSGREDRLYQDLIQTTAQINPGNSGGPLFDAAGDVIGVNCAVVLPVKQTNGIGFAIPAGPRLRAVVDRLVAGREVTYAYLGVRTTTAAPADCTAAGLPVDAGGARVDYVEAGSPAAAAGLRAGDIVTALAGAAVAASEPFIRA
ncbi:MAG: 2-alkenal reductase, partial [Phycisphaerales bacterium]|nr:2-alkenal reductase [Phycisphaerales bacterium]